MNDCLDCRKRVGNGGIPRVYFSTESDVGGYYPAHVRCEQCGLSVSGDKTDESAIVAWNAKWRMYV